MSLVGKTNQDVLLPSDDELKLETFDQEEANTLELKCVVVGSSGVGKTAMLKSYSDNTFTADYVPTVMDKNNVNLVIGKKLYFFNMADTAGEMELDRLRIVAYPGSDIFLICFSVIMPNSFRDVEELWVPEIKFHNPDTPFFLVGTQTDLRSDEEEIEKLRKDNQSPVTSEMGTKLANRVGAKTYKECSALTQDGVKLLFDQVVVVALKSRRRNAESGSFPCPCSLM